MSKNGPARPRTARRSTDTATATEPQLQRTYTIDSLAASATPPSAQLSSRVFRNTTEERLLARGKKIETSVILGSIPEFLGSTKEIYAVLSQEQQARIVGYTPRLDDLLIDEVLKLQDLKRRFDTQSATASASRVRSEAASRAIHRKAIAMRDQATTAMRSVVGDNDTAEAVELRSLRGTAETEDDLANGLESLAALIQRHLDHGDPETLGLMEELKLTAAHASQLHSTATEVRAAARAADVAAPAALVTKTMLNLQDGRVMHLVGLIYRPFREARKQDASILLPKLGGLRSQFENIYRKTPSKPTTATAAEPLPAPAPALAPAPDKTPASAPVAP